MNQNNLNELNTILFDTLRGVSDGKTDTKKANAVIGISNALINNAKVQIQAMKLAGRNFAPEFFALPEVSNDEKKKLTTDKHELMMAFAIEKGYDNVTHGISSIGKEKFMKEFQDWIG